MLKFVRHSNTELITGESNIDELVNTIIRDNKQYRDSSAQKKVVAELKAEFLKFDTGL